jgi:predicted nucleotidyltransferase
LGSMIDLKRHPYLHCHEREALEGIIDAVTDRFPWIGKIILYGSKARGDFREESDVDLLFAVEGEVSRDEKTRIYDLLFGFEVGYGVLVSAVFASPNDLSEGTSAVLKRIRKEGIEVWSRE